MGDLAELRQHLVCIRWPERERLLIVGAGDTAQSKTSVCWGAALIKHGAGLVEHPHAVAAAAPALECVRAGLSRLGEAAAAGRIARMR